MVDPKNDKEEALSEVSKVCEVRSNTCRALMVVLSSDHRFILRRQEEYKIRGNTLVIQKPRGQK